MFPYLPPTDGAPIGAWRAPSAGDRCQIGKLLRHREAVLIMQISAAQLVRPFCTVDFNSGGAPSLAD
jgi:hypothetical protein